MAQGKMKVKTTSIQRKAKHQNKKTLGPKRGGKRVIAPKKEQKIREKNLQDVLQKSINKSIEEDLAQKAGTRGLNVIKVTNDGAKSSKDILKSKVKK